MAHALSSLECSDRNSMGYSHPRGSDVIEGMTTRIVRIRSRLPIDLVPQPIGDADESGTVQTPATLIGGQEHALVLFSRWRSQSDHDPCPSVKLRGCALCGVEGFQGSYSLRLCLNRFRCVFPHKPIRAFANRAIPIEPVSYTIRTRDFVLQQGKQQVVRKHAIELTVM